MIKNTMKDSSTTLGMTKVLFFGSSDYCLPILESLHKHLKLIGVVTRPDRPIGRKQILTPSPVKSFASSHNIKVFTPGDKSKLLELKDKITALKPDLAIVADFGMIIPKEIFEIPRFKTLNIHFSNLPHLRGASPVQFTILLGEKSAWITIIIMDETMDTGDIIWKKEFPLIGTETTRELYQKLFTQAAIELPTVINQYVEKKLTPQKQDHTKATYTKIFTRADGFIPSGLILKSIGNKSNLASQGLPLQKWKLMEYMEREFQIANYELPNIVERTLRALSPWPGVWTEVEISNQPINPASPAGRQSTNQLMKKRLKILKAHVDNGKLIIDEVQLEGKNPVLWKQFQGSYTHPQTQ